MVRLIKQADLDILFPREDQQIAFLRIFKGEIAIDPRDKALVINIDDEKPVIVMRNKKQVYSDFDDDINREKFRQILSAAGHPTAYEHWALAAYDKANQNSY